MDIKMSPDEVLNLLGSRSKFLLTCILVTGITWTPLAFTGLSPAFIVKTPENSTFESISQEFDLVGDRAYLADSTTTAFMLGNMFGGIFVTQTGDKYGRHPVFITCLVLMGVFGCLSSLASDINALFCFRFIHGVFYTSAGLVGWVLAYENTSLKLRFFTSVYFGMTWVLGTCLLALIGYLTPNWRVLMVVISVPNVFCAIASYYGVPESLHYLATTVQRTKVTQWLDRARSIDGSDALDDVRAETIVSQIDSRESDKTLIQLAKEMCKHKIFLVYTGCMTYLWIVDTFVYFGLAFYATDLAGNFYLNFVLMSLVEVPAYIFAPMVMNRYGRRLLVCFSHVVAGLSFLGIVFFSESLHLPFWLLGKLSISCSFMSIYVYASEVFPTDARNKCIGFCETMSRFGGMLSPHLSLLSRVTPRLPAITLSVISVLGGLLTLLLPETLNTQLPATISETANRRRLLRQSSS